MTNIDELEEDRDPDPGVQVRKEWGEYHAKKGILPKPNPSAAKPTPTPRRKRSPTTQAPKGLEAIFSGGWELELVHDQRTNNVICTLHKSYDPAFEKLPGITDIKQAVKSWYSDSPTIGFNRDCKIELVNSAFPEDWPKINIHSPTVIAALVNSGKLRSVSLDIDAALFDQDASFFDAPIASERLLKALRMCGINDNTRDLLVRELSPYTENLSERQAQLNAVLDALGVQRNAPRR